jgi:hypothetical protein
LLIKKNINRVIILYRNKTTDRRGVKKGGVCSKRDLGLEEGFSLYSMNGKV